jgi:predicted transcriptional regulator
MPILNDDGDVIVRNRSFKVNTAFLRGYGVMLGLYLSYLMHMFSRIRGTRFDNNLLLKHTSTATSLAFTRDEEQQCFRQLAKEGIIIIDKEMPNYRPVKLSEKGIDFLNLYNYRKGKLENAIRITSGVMAE